MGYKEFLLKNIISIGENWLNKKTTPSINIPFSLKVGTIKYLRGRWYYFENRVWAVIFLIFSISKQNFIEMFIIYEDSDWTPLTFQIVRVTKISPFIYIFIFKECFFFSLCFASYHKHSTQTKNFYKLQNSKQG